MNNVYSNVNFKLEKKLFDNNFFELLDPFVTVGTVKDIQIFGHSALIYTGSPGLAWINTPGFYPTRFIRINPPNFIHLCPEKIIEIEIRKNAENLIL